MKEQTGADLTKLTHSLMPFAARLGVEIVRGDAERVVAHVAWSSENCTTGGALHGGFLMGAADSVGAMCAGFNLPQGAITSTIESKTNFFRGATEGQLRIEAIPIHVGRTTIVVQTDIIRPDGKLVTRTIQTQAVIKAG
jgi:uncharacterized protein (TIGR00369 family)